MEITVDKFDRYEEIRNEPIAKYLKEGLVNGLNSAELVEIGMNYLEYKFKFRKEEMTKEELKSHRKTLKAKLV